MKLNAKQLRGLEEMEIKADLTHVKRRPLYLILENVYDTYNIGGLFRLADALACEKIFLCGETEIPPNSRIKKASIGTYKVVTWEYYSSVTEVIERLRRDSRSSMFDLQDEKANNVRKSIQIIAVEQDERAVDYRSFDFQLPLALIVGNETTGITKETLKLVDQIVEIPMWGVNKSLNVIVSAAIVGYYAMARLF